MGVKWLSNALQSLGNISDHIATDNSERAITFVREIREKTQLLSDFPSIGKAGRVAGTRELVAHKNYIIIYRMKDENIEIIRAYHVAQKQSAELGSS
jgi:toxin ParE1/3/4